jgi:hypothetical protein
LEEYEARLFERDGKPALIHRYQARLAREGTASLLRMQRGEIRVAEYRQRMLDDAQRYVRRLVALGLMSRVFEADWFRSYADAIIAEERRLLPRIGTEPSEDDWARSCEPLRDMAKTFFRAMHVDFGVGRLQRYPDIFGGIDPSLCDAEVEIGVEAQALR